MSDKQKIDLPAVDQGLVEADAERVLSEDKLKRLKGFQNQSHNRFIVAVEAEKLLKEEQLKRLSGAKNQSHARFVTATEAEKVLQEEQAKRAKALGEQVTETRFKG